MMTSEHNLNSTSFTSIINSENQPHNNTSIKLITLNVQGLSSVQQQEKLLDFIVLHKYEIIFLSECKLSALSKEKLKKIIFPHNLVVICQKKKAEAAIILSKDLMRHCYSITTNERYVHLKLSFKNQKNLSLCSLYYPVEHGSHPSLDDSLEDIIGESLHDNLSVLIGGDLNRIISCSDHICSNSGCRRSLGSNISSKFLELGLVDVSRKINQYKIDYTHSQNGRTSKSRIDYFICSPDLLNFVEKCKINKTQPCSSTHYPVSMHINRIIFNSTNSLFLPAKCYIRMKMASETDWTNFKSATQLLELPEFDLIEGNDIDCTWNLFEYGLIHIAKQQLPFISKKRRKIKEFFPSKRQFAAVISELFQQLKENVNLTSLKNEITYEELLTCLSLMGKNKATGPSMISKEMLQQCGANCHLFLLKLFNFCLKNSWMPKSWRDFFRNTNN